MDSGIMEFLKNIELKKSQAKEKLPKVLAVYRAKFLKALGKYDGEIDTKQDLSLDGLFWRPCFVKNDMASSSKFFDDSIIVTEFLKLKQPEFELIKYIASVKWILQCYLGTNSNYTIHLRLSSVLTYVFAHSRDFNNPNTNLLKFSADGTTEIGAQDNFEFDSFTNEDIPADHQNYVKELNKLMKDLMNGYDETKYKKLNLNVTYLILFMARRCCKSENDIEKSLKTNKVHEEYANLCPMHLQGCRLPVVSKEANSMWERYVKNDNFMLMLLYGYLKSSRITRRVFRVTCITYMEYTGLALPMLFDKVATLYDVPKDVLWDSISQSKNHNVLQALFTIADYYYFIYEAGGTKTFELFPYCRTYKQFYHSNMSGKCHQNYLTCYALALLIDKKLGMDRSFVRNSAWTKAFSHVWQANASRIAAEVLSKISE